MALLKWEKGETEHLVRERFRKRQWVAILPSLRSCTDRLQHAHIHYDDLRVLFDGFRAQWLEDRSMMRSHLRGDEDFGHAMDEFMPKIQAYVAAYLQCLDVIPDTVAHMVHYAVGMNLGPDAIELFDITHAVILKRLKKKGQFAGLANLMDELTSGGVFAHVHAAVNHNKHRGMILAGVNEHLSSVGRDRYSLILKSFEFQDRRGTVKYPQVKFFDHFGPECDRLFSVVLQLGTELNLVLSRLDS